LHQNAGAYITAKLHYTDRDGMERCLETGFTRYSVIVTGQRLPNGRRADAVYLALNDPYWEVLQHAPVRPLDYEYLTTLAPSAQRFYELLSYQMFAALKYRRPEATMRYSTYCTFAPQQRYLDYDRVKKQMYKVHQPHLQSGYLAEVRTERLRGDQEAPDWLLKYTPGRKARAEYHAFTGQIDQSGPAFQVAAGGDDPPGDALSEGPVETLDGMPVSTDAPASGVSRPDPVSLMPESRSQDDTAAQATCLVQDFRQRVHGVTAVPPQAKEIEHATRLIETHGQDFATFFVPFACQTARRSDFRPQVFGGLMRYEGQALAAYWQRQAKLAREAAEAAEAREARLRQAYEQERLAQLTVFRDGLSPEVQTALETQVCEEIMAAERIPRSVLGPRLKAELYDRLAVQAGVPTYEAWLRQREETSHG
jgi:hypothetical protein